MAEDNGHNDDANGSDSQDDAHKPASATHSLQPAAAVSRLATGCGGAVTRSLALLTTQSIGFSAC